MVLCLFSCDLPLNIRAAAKTQLAVNCK